MRHGFLLLVVGLCLGAPAAPGGAGEEGEILLPGEVRERPIAAGETHAYRVEVRDAPLLIAVEQRGIDLAVEAGRLGAPEGLTSDRLPTARGREVRGEGLMGLTRGFLYAGAPRVIASLWRVQDRTTAELMTRFSIVRCGSRA